MNSKSEKQRQKTLASEVNKGIERHPSTFGGANRNVSREFMSLQQPSVNGLTTPLVLS